MPKGKQAPAPVAWGGNAAAWDKVRSMALGRLDQLIDLGPEVLRGDRRGAIHDFRVASRRFEQAFGLLCPAEPPHGLLRLRRRISRSRKALSSVRNYDVFIRAAEKKLKRPARRETWEAIRDYLVKRRAGAHSRAIRKISQVSLGRVYLGLRREIETGRARNRSAGRVHKAAPELGADNFRERIEREIARAWVEFEKASGEAREAQDDGALHPLRIAAKRLRYLMEIIHEIEKPASGRALEILRGIQDRLGEWRDLEVEERILAEMAGRPRFLRRHLKLAGGVVQVMSQNRKSRERLLAGVLPCAAGAMAEELKACILPRLRIARQGL